MATYLPDTDRRWVAAVRGGVVLVVPSVEAERVAALWPRLVDDDPMPHVLDALTADGLAATPPFALVVSDPAGSARVVVRGGVVVHVGATVVSGAGVSTWAERIVQVGDAQVRVEVDEVATDAAVHLPVTEAVVHAVAVHSGTAEPVASVDDQTRVVSAVPAPVEARVEAPAPAAATPSVGTPHTITVPPMAVVPSPASAAAAEQTMIPAEDTTAAPSTPPAGLSLDASGLDGDHDGLTVASIDLRRLRAERAARQADSRPAAGVPMPPTMTRSSLRMPDGSIEPIGSEVLLGRSPSVSQVSGGRLPRLVTIGAGDPDISRNHLRVAVEGDTVVVTDLHSRNGTHVVAPGKPPVKLRAGEPTPVLAGTVVDLGGGWTIQVVGA